jgi:hypothetical protein
MALVGSTWDPATLPALAAILGALAGALGSSVSTWIAQRHQDRRDMLFRKIAHREQLYSDFISESARVMADAVQHTFQDPSKLIAMFALISRMRLSSSVSVLKSAERIVEITLRRYAEPNLTPEEIRSGFGKREDPLREFSDVCRRELESLGSAL